MIDNGAAAIKPSKVGAEDLRFLLMFFTVRGWRLGAIGMGEVPVVLSSRLMWLFAI